MNIVKRLFTFFLMSTFCLQSFAGELFIGASVNGRMNSYKIAKQNMRNRHKNNEQIRAVQLSINQDKEGKEPEKQRSMFDKISSVFPLNFAELSLLSAKFAAGTTLAIASIEPSFAVGMFLGNRLETWDSESFLAEYRFQSILYSTMVVGVGLSFTSGFYGFSQYVASDALESDIKTTIIYGAPDVLMEMMGGYAGTNAITKSIVHGFFRLGIAPMYNRTKTNLDGLLGKSTKDSQNNGTVGFDDGIDAKNINADFLFTEIMLEIENLKNALSLETKAREEFNTQVPQERDTSVAELQKKIAELESTTTATNSADLTLIEDKIKSLENALLREKEMREEQDKIMRAKQQDELSVLQRDMLAESEFNSIKSGGSSAVQVNLSVLFGYKLNSGNFSFITEGGIDFLGGQITSKSANEVQIKSNLEFCITEKLGYKFRDNMLTYITLGVSGGTKKVNYEGSVFKINKYSNTMNFVVGAGYEITLNKNVGIFTEFNHEIPLNSIDTEIGGVLLSASKIKMGARYYFAI